MIVWADASIAPDGRAAFGATLVGGDALWYHSGDLLALRPGQAQLAELAAVVAAILWAHQHMRRASEILSVRCDSSTVVWVMAKLLGPRNDGEGQCTHPPMAIPAHLGQLAGHPVFQDTQRNWRFVGREGQRRLVVDDLAALILRPLAGAAGRMLLLDHAPRETIEIALCDRLARRQLGLKGRNVIDGALDAVVRRYSGVEDEAEDHAAG